LGYTMSGGIHFVRVLHLRLIGVPKRRINRVGLVVEDPSGEVVGIVRARVSDRVRHVVRMSDAVGKRIWKLECKVVSNLFMMRLMNVRVVCSGIHRRGSGVIYGEVLLALMVSSSHTHIALMGSSFLPG